MSDDIGLLRYQFQQLTHDNWDAFEFPMHQLLVRLGLWKYVAKTDQWLRKADKDAYDKWEAGCEKACAEIALRVTAEVMHIVRVWEDPAVIWENFRMSLGSKGWTKRLALCRQLFNAEKKSTQSMRAWTNGVRDLACKIFDIGRIVSDDELIVVLTNKLLDSYQPLIVSLELVEEKSLTVNYVVNCLINEEDRQGQEGNEEPLALSARTAKQKTPQSQITCWRCKKKGHYSYECQDEPEADVKKQNSAPDGKGDQCKPPSGSLY